MKSAPRLGIFCFRRDLRIHDNLGLNGLAKICEGGILPVFCLDPRQLDANKNQYRSNLSVRFLFESLADLDSQIRDICSKAKKPVVGLTVVAGTPEECLPNLVKSLDSSRVVVGWNEDVTPFSKERDERIKLALSKEFNQNSTTTGSKAATATIQQQQSSPSCQVEIITNPDDVTTVPIRNLFNPKTGKPFEIYTPFYKAAIAQGVNLPAAFPTSLSANQENLFISLEKEKILENLAVLDARTLLQQPRFKDIASDPATADVKGGRSEALQKLTQKYISSETANYEVDRDSPGLDKTTKLSAAFKFGCISYREAHHAVLQYLPSPTSREKLIKEFFWAQFSYYITLHFPQVLQHQKAVFNSSSNSRNADMHKGKYDFDSFWASGPKADADFKAWKEGKTGFPFIDAAMRQMNSTGYMHNRSRQAVASFLTKDLRIDWREGEKYFAQKLADYEPSANNAGWQSCASTGADSRGIRVFNPWMQSSKHDAQGVYVKKFVPELQSVAPEDICKWNEPRVREKYKDDHVASQYPAPMLDHYVESNKTIAMLENQGGGGNSNSQNHQKNNNNNNNRRGRSHSGGGGGHNNNNNNNNNGAAASSSNNHQHRNRKKGRLQ